MRRDLYTNQYAKSLLQVLEEPEQFVVVTEAQDRDTDNPLRQCLQRGWLFSEPHGEEQIKYRSHLHCMHDMQNGSCLGEQIPSSPPISKRSPQTFQPKESENKGISQKQWQHASVYSRSAISAGILSCMLQLYEKHDDYSPRMRNPKGLDQLLHSL